MTKPEKSSSAAPKGLYQLFEMEMEKLGGRAFLVAEDGVSSKLQTLLRDTIGKIVIYKSTVIDRFIPKAFADEVDNLSVEWLPAVKPADFKEEGYRRKLIEADAGLIAADYLIADSGTIVLFEKSHRAQLVTLLPPTLFVLATEHQLIPDLFTFHRIAEKDNRHRYESIQYITGPSRTSDIEKKLILGVHGPKELWVLVINE